MGRVADKPGTYRIREKGYGDYVLSGVKSNGRRIRIPFDSRQEAETFAATQFPTVGVSSTYTPASATPEVAKTPHEQRFDEWGLPLVTEETARDVGAAMGIPAPQPQQKVAEIDKKVAETQATRKKYAQSLMTLGGHAYAMGVVMGSNRLITAGGKVPVKPSPKQVTDLAEVTADTLREWFGDMEIKPWLMMCLLTIGIPLSMWIQSPKALPKRPTESPTQEETSPNLRSVT
jgi:hypothetical protein